MVQFDEEVSGIQLRAVQTLRSRLQRRRGNPNRLERAEEVELTELERARSDLHVEFCFVNLALFHRREPRILREIANAKHPAEGSELGVVLGLDRDPLVVA